MIVNRFTNLPLVLTALSLTLVIPLARGAKLPGTRPVIDAAEYPSLQAAIDAVPRTGGMLRLPPGEFVITAPLTSGAWSVVLGGRTPIAVQWNGRTVPTGATGWERQRERTVVRGSGAGHLRVQYL